MVADQANNEIVFTLDGPRWSLGFFIRGIFLSIGKKQGVLKPPATFDDYPALRAEMKGVELDAERIAAFRKLCNLAGDDSIVPPPYPEILFLDLLATIITSKHFPLSAMGTIHIAQRITQHKLLKAGETVDLDCRLAELRQTDKGIEADCSMEVTVDGELRWDGLATFLSRDMSGQKKGGDKSRKQASGPTGEPVVLHVPDDTGRRYAKVSGDYNPFHLYGITAKMFGYKRPIAHGMWSLARTMGELDAEMLAHCPLRSVTHFKTPILMPADVNIFREGSPEGELHFEMRNPKSGAPHLDMKVKKG